jgi:APA family basic amino acid/polyamine antiporter
MSNYFKTKPIDRLIRESNGGDGGSSHLKRVLGPHHLVALGIGCIIGAGIFVLTGQAAAQYAGPAIVFSFMLSALACGAAGLCYAEFASCLPVSGSAYTYAYATMGEMTAWFIGWNLVLEYLFGASTVAVGWSGYVVSFLKDFGLQSPPEFTAATGSKLILMPGTSSHWLQASTELMKSLAAQGIDINSLPVSHAIFNLPAVFIILAITAILLVGIQQSSTVNNIIVAIKLTVIALFIVFGIACIHPENWIPFVPTNTGTFGEFGISGILRGSGVIFFAYIGFDAVSTLAQEAKNPQRDMPIGLLGSLFVCTLIYIAVALVMTGIVKYTSLGVPDPIAVAVDIAGPTLIWLRPIIKVGAIAGLSSVVLVLMLGQTRVFYSIAKDGLLPPLFCKLHPKFQTPYLTTLITGLMAALFAGVLPIDTLGKLVSIGTLLDFTIVCIGIIILRFLFLELQAPYFKCFAFLLILGFD